MLTAEQFERFATGMRQIEAYQTIRRHTSGMVQ